MTGHKMDVLVAMYSQRAKEGSADCNSKVSWFNLQAFVLDW